MFVIDTHAHLTDPALFEQLTHFLAQAEAAGVRGMLAVATDRGTSQRCVEMAQTHACLHASVGIHPNYCSAAQPGDFDEVCLLASHPRVVAIGETGLDRHWDDSPWDMQVDSFRKHIDLSRRVDKPVIIHTRDCAEETLALLQEEYHRKPFRAVLHSFTGPQAVADGCLELGLYISFAGMVTYKNADDLRCIAKTIPNDRLLVETDCPYLTPHPHRGQRPNHPALVIHTLNCLAQVRGVRVANLAEQTTDNARRLFGGWLG